jgi:hypothetical protein
MKVLLTTRTDEEEFVIVQRVIALPVNAGASGHHLRASPRFRPSAAASTWTLPGAVCGAVASSTR